MLMPFRGSRRAAAGGISDPTEIAGLVRWHDASDEASITHTGGTVSQWDDKSGNGFHLTNVFGTPQTGSRTQNGLNVIDLDGSSSLQRPNIAWPATMYFYCVAGIDAVDSSGDAILGTSGGGTIRFGFDAQSASQFEGRFSSAGLGGNLAASSAARNGPGTYGLTLNAADGARRLLYQGSVIASDALYNGELDFEAKHLNVFENPAANRPDGFIAELVMYSQALSAGDEAALLQLFQNKWNVT